MRKKPLLFTLVPLVLIGVCVSLYFQTAFVLNAALTDYSRILSKITLSNWITVGAMIVSGIAILRSSKWAKLFMPLTVAIVIWNNYLVATRTHNFSKMQIILAVVLFILVFAPLYSKKIQMVLSDRRHQWWRTPFRKKYRVPIALRLPHGATYKSQTVDVSSSGLFMSLEEQGWNDLPGVGEKVDLHLYLGGEREVFCSAVIVRMCEARGSQPRGMGLQFVNFEGNNRKTLDQFLKQPAPSA